MLSAHRKAAVALTAAAFLTGGLGIALAESTAPSPTRTSTGISGPTRASAGEDVTITGRLRDAQGRALASSVLRLVGREAGSSREQNLYYGKTGSDGTVAFRFTPPAGRSSYKVVYNGSRSPKRDASQSGTLTLTVTQGPAQSPSPAPSGSATPSESATPAPTTSGEPTATASPTGGGRSCQIPLVPTSLPEPICTDNPQPTAEPTSSESPGASETPTPSSTDSPSATPTPEASASARR